MTTTTTTAPASLTRKEAAKYIGVGLTKLDELVKRGEIPCTRIDSCVRFRKLSLDVYLRTREVDSSK